MITAVIVLFCLLELATAFAGYLFYRASVSFMRDADMYKDRYLHSIVVLDDIKKKLAAEGILLLSAEEAAKLKTGTSVSDSADADDVAYVAPKKGTFH